MEIYLVSNGSLLATETIKPNQIRTMKSFNPFLGGCKNKQHYLKECRKYLLKKYRRLVLKHSLKLTLCIALVLLLIGEALIHTGVWAFGSLSYIAELTGAGLLFALDLISRLVV